MSSTQPLPGHFENVESVVKFLRDSSAGVVSTTTPTLIETRSITKGRKLTPEVKKEKEPPNRMLNLNATAVNTKENVQVLSSGRVRYGPITVNPRKQPSKTLFTGRRSKNEVLMGDEEEKRRLRRERNRVAATKCREKRENVLVHLENEYEHEVQQHNHLTETVRQLEIRREYLLSLLSNQPMLAPLSTNTPASHLQPSPLVFGNTGFLSSIAETPAPPLPSSSPPRSQLQSIFYEEEQASYFLPTASHLTNSAFQPDMADPFFLADPPTGQQTLSMNSSSLERLIDGLHTPPAILDSNNLLTSQQPGLYNSAFGTSSCAQQHSSSSEEDSLPPARNNHIVY